MPEVDEEWYLSQYPDVRAAVREGRTKSASSHYRSHGYAERRLPSKPVVDEAWYLRTYPDVAVAIREGLETSAYDHFVKIGYREGRMATPPADWKRRIVLFLSGISVVLLLIVIYMLWRGHT
jgi:hypothetical protein